MKKIIFLSALIIAIILRVFQGEWEYAGLAVALGSVIGIWLLARSFIFAQRLPAFPEISALFLSISPWHILISTDTDKSLNLLLMIFGIFILGKIFKKHSLVTVTAFLIILIFLTGPTTNLLNGFSNTQVPVWATDEQRREHSLYYNHPLVVLIHNKVINYTLSFFDHYGQHFQGDFLFISGDVRGGGGLMYLFDSVFIIWAIIFIVKNPKGWAIILILLILTPISSALGFQPPNALKAYLMIVPLTILSSLGASYIFRKIFQK